MAMSAQMERLEEDLRISLSDGTAQQLRSHLARHHPADLALLLGRLDPAARLVVLRALEPALAGAALSKAGVGVVRAVVPELALDETVALLGALPLDRAVKLLGALPPEERTPFLDRLPPEEAAEARVMLACSPHSAGRLVSPVFAAVGPEQTAAEALAEIRALGAVEGLADVYVLRPDRTLAGVLALAALVSADVHTPVASLALAPLATVSAATDREELARIVSQYDLATVPVVDGAGRMLGIVTVDDVIDVLVEESTEDALRFGAIQSGEAVQPYFATPVLRAIGRRVGWLILLFLTGSLTINVLGIFEATLEQVIALTFFIPLLIGTGGNTAAQTVSTVVRAMALGQIRPGDGGRVLVRELSSGVLLGLILAVAGFAVAFAGGNGPAIALVVACTVVVICVWANVLGALVPMAARHLGIDPALVSAPLITTLIDATGLAIYLLIARAILGI